MVIGLGSALAGIDSVSDRFAATASRVAKAGTGLPGEGDLGADIVDMDADKAALGANVAVAKAADDMLGTLIDIIA